MDSGTLDNKLARLEAMLREQQTELAVLREALARKNVASLIPAALPAGPSHLAKPDTTRRRMLKHMGLAVLAGGAALGIAATSYAPAEAKLSINPSPNVGAVITHSGASITNIPGLRYYGLITSPDDTLDASGVFPSFTVNNIGVSGFSTADNRSVGVYGFSTYGFGVMGYTNTGSGIGVYGNSLTNTGVWGETSSTGNPAVVANSSVSNSGIALQIYRGGLTMKGAGIGTQTAAFIHKTAAANISGNFSAIDNPLSNGRQNALVFVTQNANPPATGEHYDPKVIGVYYDFISSKWTIFHEDFSDMPVGLYFNVLIINP